MRRNLAIACRLVEDGRASALLIAGAREAGALPMPDGVECVTLPALRKSGDGSYRSRSLDLPLDELLALRAATIRAVLDGFDPDVLIADKHPLGFRGELQPGLDLLRGRGTTRFVLGLREVLDAPEVVRASWRRGRSREAVADYYDRVWVYGDPRVYDPVREYGLGSAVAPKVRYSGYLAREPLTRAPGAPDPLEDLDLPEGRVALCMVGGGQDGGALALAFARAPLPADMTGLVVAGPFMPDADRTALHAAAAAREDLRVLDFVKEPRALLGRVDRIVTMGGYNTVCEVLVAHRPALVVPREAPRVEQLLRAERLAGLGVLDLLREGLLSPAAIGAWLARPLGHRPHASEVVDLAGLQRVPGMLADLLDPARTDTEAAALAA
jgi:predicted glycosyltransferase